MNGFKRIIAAALAAVLTLSLAACGGKQDTEPALTTAEQTTEPQTTAAPETTAQETTTAVPGTTTEEVSHSELTPEAIKDLLVEANSFYWKWVTHGPKLDWSGDYESRAVTVNGTAYYPVPDSPFDSVEAVKEKARQYFTPDLYESRIDSLFIDYEGSLYALDASGQGGDVGPVGYRLEIKSQTEDLCRFDLVSLYEFSDPYTCSYVLVRQDGRWVFTSEFIESIIDPDAEWNF